MIAETPLWGHEPSRPAADGREGGVSGRILDLCDRAKARSPTHRRRIRRADAHRLRALRTTPDAHQLAAAAGAHGPRRACGRSVLRQLHPACARLAEAVSGSRTSRPGPLPCRLRRGRRQRRRPALPARLSGQDRHPAPARRRPAHAGGDRALDRHARPRRCGRVPAALDLGHRDELSGPAATADPGRPLRRRRLRRARRRPAAEPAPVRAPARAPAQGRRASRAPLGLHDTLRDRRRLFSARLLDGARAPPRAAGSSTSA